MHPPEPLLTPFVDHAIEVVLHLRRVELVRRRHTVAAVAVRVLVERVLRRAVLVEQPQPGAEPRHHVHEERRVHLVARVAADVLLQQLERQVAEVVVRQRGAELLTLRTIGRDRVVGQVARHAVARALVGRADAAADWVGSAA
jgi:hypothetical protein